MSASLESKVLELQKILNDVVSTTAVTAVCLIDARADRQEYLAWAPETGPGSNPPSKDVLAAVVAEWINGKPTQQILGLFGDRDGTRPAIKWIEFEAGTQKRAMKHVIRPLIDPRLSGSEVRFVLAYAVPGTVSSGALRIHIAEAEKRIQQALQLS